MYKVIAADTLKAFEDQVNKWLSQGWDLVGGVSVTTSKNGDLFFYQAVCLPEIPLED